MASKVSICNLALASLGHKAFIQSLTEESVEARYANLFYEQARRTSLRMHPWNCATIRTALALIGDGQTPWAYQYALPAGCLKARYIVGESPRYKIPFELALNGTGTGRVIYTNASEPVLVYTANLENPDLWDSQLVDVVVAKLAMLMAPTIAPARRQEATMYYGSAVRAAQASDASEGVNEEPLDPSWLNDRIGVVVPNTNGDY